MSSAKGVFIERRKTPKLRPCFSYRLFGVLWASLQKQHGC